MRLFAENYKINFESDKSYPDYPRSFPQTKNKQGLFKRKKVTLDFELPVNYCPYLLFEVNKLIKNKLKHSCFQIEIELFCFYDNQSFTFSMSSKKGPLSLTQVRFELEKYLRKLDLSNPICLLYTSDAADE